MELAVSKMWINKGTFKLPIVFVLLSVIFKERPFTTSNTETSIITSNVCQINLNNENMKCKHFVLRSFIWDLFQITEKKQQTKN